MATDKIKVESGLQLFARLTKKKGIENFYPNIFGKGPETGHVIELYSDQSTNHLIEDIISESLIPKELEGIEANVLIFSADGNFNLQSLTSIIRKKNYRRIIAQCSDPSILDDLVDLSLRNLSVIEIFDITQFYTTMQNLENILAKYPNISLIVIDTLTGFYWSEQEYIIKKMDLYLKKLISFIQKVTKDHKVTILYSRPGYFSSKKESIDNLEPCCEHPTEEQVNYRIQVVYNCNKRHNIRIQSHNTLSTVDFLISNNGIEWV